jgi:hypothetical protein
VSSGASYSYRVAAFDAAGNTTLSAPVAATVPAPPPPPLPPDPDTPTNTVAPPTGDGTPGGDPPVVAPPGDPVVTTDDPPVLPPLDTIRPSVTIVAPVHRARVRRRATLRALAADAAGVVRTQVWVDRRLRKSVAGPAATWKLRRLRPGRHLIVVRAYDAAGNHGMASVRVRIIR